MNSFSTSSGPKKISPRISRFLISFSIVFGGHLGHLASAIQELVGHLQRLGPGAFGSVSVSGVPNGSREVCGDLGKMELVTFDQGHIRYIMTY